ncbi:MAG TPA: aa3-type cytochrome c oxidase subunit IV [Sphingobium sp.]|nr:aa3-type cytochrome c oxidase subunit IV [Sphingobium sp.]
MAAEGNMDSANQTYASFVSLMKWGTIASAIVGALVVVLIAS